MKRRVSAEVEQHRLLVGQHQEVVRRDVAVEAIGAVDDFQCIEYGRQKAFDPGFFELRAFVEDLAERLADIERHHHIGGAVGFPEAEDLDERGVVKLRQQARFIHKAATAGGKGFEVYV